MRIPRSTLSILTIGTLALSAAAAPASAAPVAEHAAPAPAALSADEQARIAQRLADFDVPEGLRPALLDAAEHGRPFDAATGAASASVDTVVHDGLAYEVSRFADGSFIATALETPESGGSVRSDDIQGCSRYTGAGVME
jgi:hypothetical protein